MKTVDEINDQVITAINDLCELMEDTMDRNVYCWMSDAIKHLKVAKDHLHVASLLECS